MTGVAVGVVILVALAVTVTALAVVARERGRAHQPGAADEASAEVAAGLLAELRKWQAEAAHWKATAERLQREADRRDG